MSKKVTDEIDLPEEPPLQPEEAAGALREVRRISGRPARPPEPAAEPESTAEPAPVVPWGPLRPDEVPS